MALAALARYGNRSVAVPFVKDFKYHGKKIDQNAGTLSQYFDLNALNQKLYFYGYGLLKGWRRFQQRCSQSLGLMLNVTAVLTLEGQNASNAGLSDSQRQLPKKTGWTPCFSGLHQTGNWFKGLNINQTICFDPEIITSVQQLESDVLRGSSCVGFVEWRGVRNGRCHFPFLLTKYLRHLVFGARCHLAVDLCKQRKNFQLNNLEIAIFQFTFAPNGF